MVVQCVNTRIVVAVQIACSLVILPSPRANNGYDSPTDPSSSHLPPPTSPPPSPYNTPNSNRTIAPATLPSSVRPIRLPIASANISSSNTPI